jgi:hypothetical protein
MFCIDESKDSVMVGVMPALTSLCQMILVDRLAPTCCANLAFAL